MAGTWEKVSNVTWQCSDGRFIARFNWGVAGVWYLLYESKQAYQKPGSDYQSFETLTEAKNHGNQ